MNRSNSVRARDMAYVVHQQTDLKTYSEHGGTVMERGEGIYVFDDSGKKYLDAMAGMWCASLGFSERRLATAAYEQLLRLPYYHIFNDKGHVPSVDLAERLIAVAPKVPGMAPMSKVLFQCSGSEANESAIKLIWYYHNAIGKPRKKKIIGRRRGYHGNTIATVSLSGQPKMHADFDVPMHNFLHADNPHYYRHGEAGETEEQFAERMAAQLEHLILNEGPDTIAAFFAEPVQGGGGVIIPPATYFDRVQPILKKYDILFVADEVICGFGRTGRMWGCETYDLRPDMISCAKAMSAGYQPISALMMSDRIFDALIAGSEKHGIFAHGFTYAAHPVCCAVALETLRIYEEDRILEHVTSIAPVMQSGLRELLDHPLVGDVAGVGLLAGVEIVSDKSTRAPFDPSLRVGYRVQQACHDLGLVIRAIEDRIAFTPPLIIKNVEVAEMIGLFRQGLDSVWNEIRAN